MFAQKRHLEAVPNTCTVILSKAKDLNLTKIEILRPSKLHVSLLTFQDDGAKNEHNNKMKTNLPILPKRNILPLNQ